MNWLYRFRNWELFCYKSCSVMSSYTISPLHIWASERLQHYRPQKVTVGPINQALQDSHQKKKYLGRGTSFYSSKETDAVSCGTGRTTSSLSTIWRHIALSHWWQAPGLLPSWPHDHRADDVLPHPSLALHLKLPLKTCWRQPEGQQFAGRS